MVDAAKIVTKQSAMPLLALHGIGRGFDATDGFISILKGLELEMDPGQSLAIVGASGIGKSTLLHILGTLDTPDAGSYHFDGEDVLRFSKDRLARFRNASIGFVFQFHHLLAEFNAVENTLMPALIQGLAHPEALTRATAMLTRVGLAHRLQHPVNKLSGGEQQRVALARALVLNPQLLLADEPTGNLDQSNSRQMHELLLELNREIGMTLIVATHNQELAGLMQRRMTLENGRLIDI